MTEQEEKHRIRTVGGHILVGVLTIAPLAVTWFILDFLFRLLSRVGSPLVTAGVHALSDNYREVAVWIDNEVFLSVLAIVSVLILLWFLGWMAAHVIGRRLIVFMETLIFKIPFVERIYNASKKFLTVASSSPEGERRVVLIDFPSPNMKAVGLCTRFLKDSKTGKELAAVYVPTSPNPTSGYIEIVPVEELTFTDWTFDQAMSFVFTGGANAPDTINYFEKGKDPLAPSQPPSQPPSPIKTDQ